MSAFWIQRLMVAFRSFMFLLVGASVASAQEDGANVIQWIEDAEAKVVSSLEGYKDLQRKIADEKIPLIEKIGELENRVINKRAALELMREERASMTSPVNEKIRQGKNLRAQNEYISSLWREYVDKFESRLHVAEVQEYDDEIKKIHDRLSLEDAHTLEELTAKADGVMLGIRRLEKSIGGYEFRGKASGEDGLVVEGSINTFGTIAFFRNDSGDTAGALIFAAADEYPAIAPMPTDYSQMVAQYGKGGADLLPLDATGGKGLTIAEVEGDWVAHIQKGGPVGYAIIIMGGLAALLALMKLWDFSRLAVSRPANLASIATLACDGEIEKAKAECEKTKGWMGDMLSEASEYASDDRELLEDHMLGIILQRKPRLERFLPWLAVTAAAAPLMGLLGTVVGMIETFTLITFFGSGDPKSLSSGISEALVTTELGLIVAIPTLVVHGALTRMVKKRLGSLELTATEFATLVSRLAKKSES